MRALLGGVSVGVDGFGETTRDDGGAEAGLEHAADLVSMSPSKYVP